MHYKQVHPHYFVSIKLSFVFDNQHIEDLIVLELMQAIKIFKLVFINTKKHKSTRLLFVSEFDLFYMYKTINFYLIYINNLLNYSFQLLNKVYRDFQVLMKITFLLMIVKEEVNTKYPQQLIEDDLQLPKQKI